VLDEQGHEAAACPIFFVFRLRPAAAAVLAGEAVKEQGQGPTNVSKLVEPEPSKQRNAAYPLLPTDDALLLLCLQVKQWRHHNGRNEREMKRAVRQGMMRLYDVTSMQPLVLWEVPSYRDSRHNNQQQMPVGAVLCGNRLE
jgi:hypothetical protein